MEHVFAELKEWHEFYLMVGSAAGALLALLFVAVSVGVGFLTNRSEGETRTYISSVVVHFSSVVFVSAVGLAPVKWPAFTALVIGVAGVVGSGVAIMSSIRSFAHRGRLIVPFDRYAYGVIPGLGQAGIVVAAVLFGAGIHWAPEVLAAALLLLLLINIRNAWDTVLTIVREQGRRERRKS
jgi:hypothetical protein